MIPLQAIVTFWSTLKHTHGMISERVTWDGLFSQFSRAEQFLGDDQPGWSPALFEPCERKLENVVEVSALVLDYDGAENLDTAAGLWGDYYGFIHTTRKHTPSAHRFRVILPFSRTVTTDEYAGIWRRVNAKAGGKLDQAPKDPSRFWYTPGSANVETFQVRRLVKALMDPDVVLGWPDPKAKPRTTVLDRLLLANNSNAVRRASGCLATSPPAISGNKGHEALWSATWMLAHGFALDEGDAFSLLWNEYNPRCQPPWSEREIRHKIRGVIDKPTTTHPRGFLLEQTSAAWRERGMSSLQLAPRAPTQDVEDAAEDWERYPGAQHELPRRPEDAEAREDEPPTPLAPVPDAATKYRVRSMGQILSGVFSRASQPKTEIGARCGIGPIDELIGGFRPGKVTVLGAQTSWGKSTFAILASDVTMKAGKRVLLVTGEDTEDTYGQRYMARRSNVNALSLRDRDLDEEDMRRMSQVLVNVESDPFFLDGIGQTVEYLAEAVRALCGQFGIDLVIVDYIQAFKVAKKCQDRRVEITHVAREFTDAIKGSGASGLMLSQIRRLEENARPTKHDLKESGDVENMAEHILLGYSVVDTSKQIEEREHSKKRYIIIDKNKDGPVPGVPFEIQMNPTTASFEEQKAQTREKRAATGSYPSRYGE